jgi:hypothetical protein
MNNTATKERALTRDQARAFRRLFMASMLLDMMDNIEKDLHVSCADKEKINKELRRVYDISKEKDRALALWDASAEEIITYVKANY